MKYVNNLEDILEHTTKYKYFDIYVEDQSKFVEKFKKYFGFKEKFEVEESVLLWKYFGYNRDVRFMDLKIYLNLEDMNFNFHDRNICII